MKFIRNVCAALGAAIIAHELWLVGSIGLEKIRGRP